MNELYNYYNTIYFMSIYYTGIYSEIRMKNSLRMYENVYTYNRM